MATGYSTSRKNILKTQPPLRFGQDGKFNILHLTDIHKVHPDMDDEIDRTIPDIKSKNTLATIEKAIERTNPDLVVFGGDNIGGHWEEMTDEYALWCINQIIASVKKYNVPLAIVFGNHDGQNEHIAPLLSKEIQMSIYMQYDNFRGCYNEADVYGCGNYHLPILASDSNEIKWNIWCIDSNDYPRNPDYSVINYDADCIHKDQLEWYENTVKEEKSKYGRTIPAILFQHMPINQENDYVKECAENEAECAHKGKFYRTKAGSEKEGYMHELPSTPEDRSQFEAWKKCGDIKAAFFGHDHVNTFRFDIDGISIYQTISCGYETYGEEHGGRLITLFEDGESLQTETIIIKPQYR